MDFIPEIIVDCGANIGLASVWFKGMYPSARIVCVEPESSNFEMLSRNTEGYDDVHLLQSGVWWRSAPLIIEDISAQNWGFTIREVEPGAPVPADAVDAVSIADIMKRFGLPRIDVLKMDIEGSEKEVFTHGFEEWLPLVRVLIVELHDRMKRGCAKALFDALQGYDYRMKLSGDNLVFFFDE